MKICLGRATILVASTLQSTLAMNTTASEYAAASDTINNLMHIINILNPIIVIDYPVVLNMDNTAAIRIGYNAFGTAKAKYVDLRYHNVRNGVLAGRYVLKFNKGNKFDVDMCTKNKPKATFIPNRDSILGITIEQVQLYVTQL